MHGFDTPSSSPPLLYGLTSDLVIQAPSGRGRSIPLYPTNTRTTCTAAHFSAINQLLHDWSARCPITPTPRSSELTSNITNPRDLHRRGHRTLTTMLSPHRYWLNQMSSHLTTRDEGVPPQRQPPHYDHCRVV